MTDKAFGAPVSQDGLSSPTEPSFTVSALTGFDPSRAAYLEVLADVRYWEDALVGGKEDEDGDLIPFRDGETWRPWIDLSAGTVADWPRGLTADIHYKVCDAGDYYLTDGERRRIAKWAGSYVPSAFLCHGDNGYGDYIIFKVDENGAIANWRQPSIDSGEWNAVAAPTSSPEATAPHTAPSSPRSASTSGDE